MRYLYTYEVADSLILTINQEYEAHELRYHPNIVQIVKTVAIASGPHLEDGTFELELTLGLVKVTVKPI